MKMLDRYLVSQFLKVLAGSLLFCVILYLVQIYIENVGRYFTRDEIPTLLVVQYLINRIPEIVYLMFPSAVGFLSLSGLEGSWDITS